ncbi:MAG: DUF5335 family protein [Balneolaceae bacterium]|jgi:uncharacterized protein YuzE
MATKKIDKKEWKQYFDSFSMKFLKDEQPEYIEIQILSETLGAQTEMSWTPLKGITYDPKSDLLEIQIDKMEHLISHPEEIYVEEVENGWVTGMQITQKSGEKNIIDIR